MRRVVLTLVMAALPGAALAANKDIERLQIQVATLQTQVASVERMAEEQLKEIKRLSDLLNEQTASSRRAAQDRRLQEEAISASLKDLTDRLQEISEQLQTLEASRAAAAPPATGLPPGGAPADGAPGGAGGLPPAVPSAAPPAPRELYSQAYADYARGNYDLAIQEYQEYLRNYPDTDLSDNAQYWIGECLYAKKQYEEALAAWDELFRRYPGSDKLPDARFKKGMALERLGRRSQALIEYRFVASRYPNSEAGRKARERLNPQ